MRAGRRTDKMAGSTSGVDWMVDTMLSNIAEITDSSNEESGRKIPDAASESNNGASGRIRMFSCSPETSGEATNPVIETGSERTRSGRTVAESSWMIRVGHAPASGESAVDARVVNTVLSGVNAAAYETVVRGMTVVDENANTVWVDDARAVGGDDDDADASPVLEEAIEKADDMGDGQDEGELHDREALYRVATPASG